MAKLMTYPQTKEKDKLAVLYEFSFFSENPHKPLSRVDPVLQQNLKFIRQSDVILGGISRKDTSALVRLFFYYIQFKTEQIRTEILSNNPQLPSNDKQLKNQLEKKLASKLQRLLNYFQQTLSEDLIFHHLCAWLSHLTTQIVEELRKNFGFLFDGDKNGDFCHELNEVALTETSNPYLFFLNFQEKEADCNLWYRHLISWSKSKIKGKIIDYLRSPFRFGDNFARSDLSLVSRYSRKTIKEALNYAGSTQNLETKLNIIRVFKDVKEAGLIKIQNKDFQQYQEIIDRYNKRNEQLNKSTLNYSPAEIKEMLENTGKAIREYQKNPIVFTKSLDTPMYGDNDKTSLGDNIPDKSQNHLLFLIEQEQYEFLSNILIEVLKKFDDKEQNIFVLLFWLEMPQVQIAKELGLSDQNTPVSRKKKSLIDRCIKALQDDEKQQYPVSSLDKESLKVLKDLITDCFTEYYNRVFL